MIINDVNVLLRTYRKEIRYEGALIRLKNRPRCIFMDGFSISIQASEGHYCSPRTNDDVNYTKVELGFPNREEELIKEFAEDDSDLTETVYGWVPVKIVNRMITKHGGIVGIKPTNWGEA